MNRRSFIAKAVAGAAAIPLIGLCLPSAKKYGRVNINEHTEIARRLRCFVNGAEVTNECFEADDIEGYALCYRRNKDGKLYFDRDYDQIVYDKLTGNVVLTARA